MKRAKPTERRNGMRMITRTIQFHINREDLVYLIAQSCAWAYSYTKGVEGYVAEIQKDFPSYSKLMRKLDTDLLSGQDAGSFSCDNRSELDVFFDDYDNSRQIIEDHLDEIYPDFKE